jgi:hypothetical protein
MHWVRYGRKSKGGVSGSLMPTSEAVEKLGIAGTRMFFVDKSESLRQVMLGRANPALEDKWKRIFTRVI